MSSQGAALSNFRNVKIVWALRMGTDPVLVFIREEQIYFNLWKVDILRILAGQASQPDMQVGCLLGFGKLLCILKWMRNLTGSQCNNVLESERRHHTWNASTVARKSTSPVWRLRRYENCYWYHQFWMTRHGIDRGDARGGCETQSGSRLLEVLYHQITSSTSYDCSRGKE